MPTDSLASSMALTDLKIDGSTFFCGKMMVSLRTLAIVACSIGMIVGCRASDGIQLYQLQKAIMELQSRSVSGDVQAHEKARQLMILVNQQLETSTFENLNTRRNTIAAAAYLIGGGKPVAVRRALMMGKFHPAERAMLEGVLAFSEGQANYAREKLAAIQPLSVDPVLAGPLAFAKATLEMQSNYEAAMHLYDIVRLVSPKSAFEEASMRRRAIMLADQQNAGAFFEIASKYMKRFPQSPYADAFREEVLRIFKNILEKGGEVNPDNLFDLVDLYPANERTGILISLSREASLSGNLPLSDKIAERALAKKTDSENVQKLSDIRDVNSAARQVGDNSISNVSGGPAGEGEEVVWRYLPQTIRKIQYTKTRDAIASGPARAALQTWDGSPEDMKLTTKKVPELLAAAAAELQEKTK